MSHRPGSVTPTGPGSLCSVMGLLLLRVILVGALQLWSCQTCGALCSRMCVCVKVVLLSFTKNYILLDTLNTVPGGSRVLYEDRASISHSPGSLLQIPDWVVITPSTHPFDPKAPCLLLSPHKSVVGSMTGNSLFTFVFPAPRTVPGPRWVLNLCSWSESHLLFGFLRLVLFPLFFWLSLVSFVWCLPSLTYHLECLFLPRPLDYWSGFEQSTRFEINTFFWWCISFLGLL